jgi:hypothetical protein
MFEWLDKELTTIKTRKFHIVDGPISEPNRALVEGSELGIPDSYKAFVVRFGNAQLYRMTGGHAISVFAVPRDATTVDGEPLLCFGYASQYAYFKESLWRPDRRECPVFEWSKEEGLRQTASGFRAWLNRNRRNARANFSNAEWRQILAGPLPFSSHELRIIEARRLFQWRRVGVTATGEVEIEIHNASTMVLPYLSIGVRTPRFDGGVWLDVAAIAPGSTRIVAKACYKELASSEDVELFAKPDPEPEDRDRYWEFKGIDRQHEND